MKLHRMFARLGRGRVLVCAAACVTWLATSSATNYNPVPGVTAAPGPGIPPVHLVPGKEYSDFLDKDENGLLDDDQVLAWDGFGGTRDGFDYSFSRLAYNTPVSRLGQVDGLAAPGDALFREVIADQSALLFTTGNPLVGIGGGHVFVEPIAAAGGVLATQVWATPQQVDSFLPFAVDGLEVWGENSVDDAINYSLYGDDFVVDAAGARKVAVWEYTPAGNTSDPLIYTEGPAEAIALLLGDLGLKNQYVELLDVDAIMTYGPELLFSVAPITVLDSLGNPVTLDGGEIFVWDGVQGSAATFLRHGGHLWDTAFDVVGTFGPAGLGLPVTDENIIGLEAISIPEPSSLALACGALLAGLAFAQRRRSRVLV